MPANRVERNEPAARRSPEVGVDVRFGEAAAVLREVGTYEEGADVRRAAISFGVAGLIDACARTWPMLPPDVAREVAVVVRAVDRAAGLSGSR